MTEVAISSTIHYTDRISSAINCSASGLRTSVSSHKCVWNIMAHAQKPDFIFHWNGRVHLNRRGHQFSRLLTAEVRASVVVMLNTPCSEVLWRVLATHSPRQFPLHFPSRASPCAIRFQTHSTSDWQVTEAWLKMCSHAGTICIIQCCSTVTVRKAVFSDRPQYFVLLSVKLHASCIY
jgi:hypothetical protein